MNAVVATSILIISVLIIMLITTCALAAVHGWQDGPDSHTHDRHQWIPRLLYETGWRAKRYRLTVARRELEEARAVEDEKTRRFYAELARRVQDEIARKEHR